MCSLILIHLHLTQGFQIIYYDLILFITHWIQILQTAKNYRDFSAVQINLHEVSVTLSPPGNSKCWTGIRKETKDMSEVMCAILKYKIK